MKVPLLSDEETEAAMLLTTPPARLTSRVPQRRSLLWCLGAFCGKSARSLFSYFWLYGVSLRVLITHYAPSLCYRYYW